MNARCKDHPDAPHGYDHNGSHNAGRYVCVCEAWERDEGARMSGIELPAPAGRLTECPDGWVNHGAAGYSAEQVCQLIAAERERCARVAEGTTKFGAYANGNTIPDEIAAAIRRGSV